MAGRFRIIARTVEQINGGLSSSLWYDRLGFQAAENGILALPFEAFPWQQWRGAKSKAIVEDAAYEAWDPKDFKSEAQSETRLVSKKASSKTLVKKKPHKSFRLRTEKYMRPFKLDVFISKRFVNASIMHRVTSRVIACASTNSKEFRPNPSRTDIVACKTIGQYLAERAKEADCFTAMYVPRPGQTPLVQGRIAAVVKSVADNGITLFHGEKGVTLSYE